LFATAWSGYVLVGGGVEHHVGPLGREHPLHRVRVLAVRDHRDQQPCVAALAQLHVDLEQVVLGVVDQDQPARADRGHLAAQLAADRAAGAGDEHGATVQVAGHAGEVDLDRGAAEDVLHAHLA
jgi:hypothetical protein